MKKFLLNLCSAIYSFLILGRLNDLLRWLSDYGFSFGVDWTNVWLWAILGLPIFVFAPIALAYVSAIPANKMIGDSKTGFVLCSIIISLHIIVAIVVCITDCIGYFSMYTDSRGWYLTFKIGAAITAIISYLVIIFRIKDLDFLG